MADARKRLVSFWVTHQESPEAMAETVHRCFPESAVTLIQQADQAMQGYQVLPGTGMKPYFVGDPPKWHENPCNDNEYVWVLNRLRCVVLLLKAYLLTKDEKYCDKALLLWENWIDECKRPSLTYLIEKCNGGTPVSPWRTLEAGIRMYDAWPFMLRVLLPNPKMTPALYEKILISTYEHGEALDECCRYYWPDAAHNHYLMENLGLMTLSFYFPELKHAQTWKAYAVHELERCARAQLTADGAQIEGIPGYHNFCMELFYRVVDRAGRFGITLSEDFIDRFRKAGDYSLHSFRPNGTMVLLGDSFDLLCSLSGLIYDYLLFGDTKKLNAARGYVSDTVLRGIAGTMIWKLDSSAKLQSFLRGDYISDEPCDLPLVNHQRHLDQMMMRTSWDKDALSLLFTCHTPIENLHTHIDPMGFDFTALGQNIIVDPGTFCYREDAQRKKYKIALWHSVLMVNDAEPFAYVSSWAFGPQKEGRFTAHGTDERMMFVEAMHENYAPALHKRFIAIVDKTYLIVVDRVENLVPSDTIQLYYHFDSLSLTREADNRFVCALGDSVAVRCVFSEGLAGEVLEGTISEGIDMERPSTRLCLRDSGQASVRVFASVFYPVKGGTLPDVKICSCTYDETGMALELSIAGKQVRLANPM